MTMNETVHSQPHTLVIKLLGVNQFLLMKFINKTRLYGWPNKQIYFLSELNGIA